MICPGQKRKLNIATASRRGKGEAVYTVRTPGSTVCLIAAWMLFLTCGLGWAAQSPSVLGPDQVRCPLVSVAWNQAGHAKLGDGSGYAGSAVVHPSPSQTDHEHLGTWLRQHQNMSFPEQERALRTEPGFNRLPPTRQQRLLDRLQQLDAMPPDRRERMLARLETWERLSPEQRQQVRAGILEVHQMPFDRQIMIHRAVRDLSQFPQTQRGEILNSPEFRRHYSDYERQVLATLMMAQPYEPLRPQ